MAPSVQVVGFIDMDCFYVAVERVRDASLRGLPCAVVQYNTAVRGAPDLLADMNRIRQGHDAMGGIIAVSYEARARGVTRQMSGKEALKICPDIKLVQVPTGFGKADLRIYKAAGEEVVALLSRRADATEKRSVDEVAIDITSEARRLIRERDWATDLLPKAKGVSHLADSAVSRKAAAVSRESTRKGHEGQLKIQADAGGTHDDEDAAWEHLLSRTTSDNQPDPACCVQKLLVAGAIVIAELRAQVKDSLGFTCSGGVATNKMLAKLGCGLHKPDQQTVVLPHTVPLLMRDLPLDRLAGLGGDFGEHIKAAFGISTVGELLATPRHDVIRALPERGEWLCAFASGKDSAVDPVKDRHLTKSLSNCKTFFGSNRLTKPEEVNHWLEEFAGELHLRYVEEVKHHQRAPTTLCVSIGTGGGHGSGPAYWEQEQHTKQQSIDLGRRGTVFQISTNAKACFRKWHRGVKEVPLAITSLGLSLTGMVQIESRVSITSYFAAAASVPTSAQDSASATATVEAVEAAREGVVAIAPLARKSGPIAHFFRGAPVKRTASKSDLILEPGSQIDEAVLAELPWDIQLEVRAQTQRQTDAGRESLSAVKKPRRFGEVRTGNLVAKITID